MSLDTVDAQLAIAMPIIEHQLHDSFFTIVSLDRDYANRLMRKHAIMDVIELRDFCEILATHAVKGWRNVFKPDGTEFEFSVENCVIALETSQLLLEFVVSKAINHDLRGV